MTAFYYQSTIINPMLVDLYELDVEKSSLLYTLSGVAFIIAAPVAFQLRSRKIMKRRVIIYFAMFLTSFALIIRTGNLLGNEKIYWVYIGQISNGSAFALLTTSTIPEIVDSVENTDMY